MAVENPKKGMVVRCRGEKATISAIDKDPEGRVMFSLSFVGRATGWRVPADSCEEVNEEGE